MRNIRLFSAVAAGVIAWAVFETSASGSEDAPVGQHALAVHVEAAAELGLRRSWNLQLRLSNRSDETLLVHRSTLWRGNIDLALVEAGDRRILREDFFPDDLPPGWWTLGPGQVAESYVTLSDRFPELSKALERGSVVVFWSLEVQLVDDERTKRVGGFVVAVDPDSAQRPANASK